MLTERSKELVKGDAPLYLFGAVFALLTIIISGFSDYRLWATVAIWVYGIGFIFAVGLSFLRNRSLRFYLRVALAVFIFIGALIVPLTTEVVHRAHGTSQSYVQPEVWVVENAGKRVINGKSPYVSPPRKIGQSLLSTPAPLPVYSYFDYLPLMSIFGTLRSTDEPKALTDARIPFSIVGIGAIVLSLFLLRKNREACLKVGIVTAVLPTAALPLVTGGDDLPVIGIMLLAATLMMRKKPVLGAVALGLACGLKFTAWPLAAMLILVAKRKDGRSYKMPTLVVFLGVLFSSLVPAILDNPFGFITDAIRFPLGLAGTKSPAQSPMPGHLLIDTFPNWHFEIILGLIALSLLLAVSWIKFFPIVSIERALLGSGVLMLIATVLAPSTRVGYIVYPVECFAWAWLVWKSDPNNFSSIDKLHVDEEFLLTKT